MLDRINNMLIFILQGYQQETPEGRLTDSVTIELVDKDYTSALKRAEKIVKKKFWRLSNVIEKEV